jgi:RHS repeat-associated protein
VYFLKDHLGSIRATVDNTGAVVGYDDYDPWGFILANRSLATPWSSVQGTAKNKFTSKEFDDDFGLNWLHLGWRPYDSQIARFFIVDPLWVKHPDVSPYAYVLNNPVRLVDPDGRQVDVHDMRFLRDQLLRREGFSELELEALHRYDQTADQVATGILSTLLPASGITGGLIGTATDIATGDFSLVGTALNFLSGGKGKAAEEGIDATRTLSKLGDAARELGKAREQKVADLVGGIVSGEKIKVHKVGSTDIDVIGPAGELIAVGGPGKAKEIQKFGQKLSILARYAAEKGVTAKAYFAKGTPEDVLNLARKHLGEENVFIFE